MYSFLVAGFVTSPSCLRLGLGLSLSAAQAHCEKRLDRGLNKLIFSPICKDSATEGRFLPRPESLLDITDLSPVLR